jgi:hypothetical protein
VVTTPTTTSLIAMAANHRKSAGSGTDSWGFNAEKYVTPPQAFCPPEPEPTVLADISSSYPARLAYKSPSGILRLSNRLLNI